MALRLKSFSDLKRCIALLHIELLAVLSLKVCAVGKTVFLRTLTIIYLSLTIAAKNGQRFFDMTIPLKIHPTISIRVSALASNDRNPSSQIQLVHDFQLAKTKLWVLDSIRILHIM